MTTLKKLKATFYPQKNTFWAFGSVGSPEIGGKDIRVRKSLGTDSESVASERVRRILGACEQGAESNYWPNLRAELPPPTFKFFADLVGFKDNAPVVKKVEPTWNDLLAAYSKHLNRPIESGKRVGKLRTEGTKENYQQTFTTFARFLTEKGLANLIDITSTVAQTEFQDWRIADISKKKNCRPSADKTKLPARYIFDVVALCGIFDFAVEQKLIAKTPFRYMGKPGADAEHGASPFAKTELDALVRHAGTDLLTVLVLLRTGFRRSDAIKLQWKHVGSTHIALTAQKNGNKVRIPMSADLTSALAAVRTERYGKVDSEEYANDFVLLNPYTGSPFNTGKKLYERVKRVGERAGVKRVHPHRFRDTFAKDCFAKGCDITEVANFLGDKPETVAAHYNEMDAERRQSADKKFLGGDGLLAPIDFSELELARKSKVVSIGRKKQAAA